MAASKRCSMCKKELGPMHCTGCDEYFCCKDFKTHREGIFTKLDEIIEERNHLEVEVKTVTQNNNQKNPLLDQIDKWRDDTIEKVKQVAAQVRQEAIQLFNSKRTKISTDFQSLSQELTDLKKSENYAEHDLTRLSQMINNFIEDLAQATKPAMIKLYTGQSDAIDWNHVIYVRDEQIYTDMKQQQTTGKLHTIICSRN
jgi:chromosome segregation ATPase